MGWLVGNKSINNEFLTVLVLESKGQASRKVGFNSPGRGEEGPAPRKATSIKMIPAKHPNGNPFRFHLELSQNSRIVHSEPI